MCVCVCVCVCARVSLQRVITHTVKPTRTHTYTFPSACAQVCVTAALCPAASALPERRARRSVRRLRPEDRGPLLPAGRGQAVAHALPQVLRVQTQPGVGAHLLQQRRQHLLQGGLLQVGPGAHARATQLLQWAPRPRRRRDHPGGEFRNQWSDDLKDPPKSCGCRCAATAAFGRIRVEFGPDSKRRRLRLAPGDSSEQKRLRMAEPNPRTLQPSNPPTLEPSNPPTLEPSNPPTL